MKLSINKACDLNSISVLPPQSRRLSAIPNRQPTSQLRSQQSQQSFSQGCSSQNGLFSQLSQSSFDETLTNDQKFPSQERENSVKKASCFPPGSYAREDSQTHFSRSSTNIMRKWNPASVPDYKCQINEELEHRLGMMETSLNKIGMILDSVQSDIMQLNKGTKEATLEMEGIRQKLVALDTSLQLLIKGQEDTKVSLDGNLKSVSEQLSKDIFQGKLQQIFLVLSALSKQMEASLLKLQSDLSLTFTKELQGAVCNMKFPNQNNSSIMMLPAKVTGSHNTPERNPKSIRNQATPSKSCRQSVISKIERRNRNTVKTEQATFTQKSFHKEQKHKRVSSTLKDEQCSVIIDSDEEIDEVFSCLFDKNVAGMGKYTVEAVDDSKRILRKARRRKRRHCSPIIIN